MRLTTNEIGVRVADLLAAHPAMEHDSATGLVAQALGLTQYEVTCAWDDYRAQVARTRGGTP